MPLTIHSYMIFEPSGYACNIIYILLRMLFILAHIHMNETFFYEAMLAHLDVYPFQNSTFEYFMTWFG